MRLELNSGEVIGEENLKRVKEKLSSYDLIIWEVPVPTKLRSNMGNHDWVDFYNCCSKNIAVIHDGNLNKIPWIYEVKDKFVGLACVHECAYNTSSILDIPRSLILNPQDLLGLEMLNDYNERKRGFLSLQVFKAWKHVDDVIRAIPYLPESYEKVIAGGGIEQRYMVSRDKVKPRYVCSSNYDPDIPESICGFARIWDRALWYGMKYIGFISGMKRDMILREVRTLIDPSWSRTYSEKGSHFNRVIVDAMKQGTVPIAVNLGMSSKESGEGLIFKPNENYIMIPYNSTPKEYASIIEYANNLPKYIYEELLYNNYKLLNLFDRRKVAQDYIDLSNGKKCGPLSKRIKSVNVDPTLPERSEYEMVSFFGRKKKEVKEKGFAKIGGEYTFLYKTFFNFIKALSGYGKLKLSKGNIYLIIDNKPRICIIEKQSSKKRLVLCLIGAVGSESKFSLMEPNLDAMLILSKSKIFLSVTNGNIDDCLEIIRIFLNWIK